MAPGGARGCVVGLVAAVVTLTGCAGGGPPAGDSVLDPGKLDVIFVATDIEVVRAMLTLAAVRPDDVVFDLGCGDGRIVIAAAKEFGARGVGVDLDPRLIQEARAQAERVGVGDRVIFRVEDLFATDLRTATVVTLFLSPELNARLRPKLVGELRPGARIVSHRHGIGDWTPDRAVTVTAHERRNHIFLWRAPGRP
jgi:SAM-dependent methyltransferase